MQVQVITNRAHYLPAALVEVEEGRMRVEFDAEDGTIVYGYRVSLPYDPARDIHPALWSAPILFPQPRRVDGGPATFTIVQRAPGAVTEPAAQVPQ